MSLVIVHWRILLNFYPSTGTYNVHLTVWNQCYSDTISAFIDVNSIGLDEDEPTQFKVFPNPARSFVYFNDELNQKPFQLIDLH